MKQTIEKLNDELAAARAELTQALIAGSDTASIRAQIAKIEDDISKVENQLAEASAEIDRIEVAAVEKAGTELADQTHEAIVAGALVEGLEAFSDEPLPSVARNPQLDHIARLVAKATSDLAKAESEYMQHAEKLKALTSRLDEKKAAIETIKQRRYAGDERSTDAAEVALLQADADAISQLVADAKQEASNADRRQAARDALAAGNAELDRLQKQAVFEASRARVHHAQELFVAAWRQMVEHGRAVGQHSPWQAYQASPEMKRAVTGAIIPGYRGGF